MGPFLLPVVAAALALLALLAAPPCGLAGQPYYYDPPAPSPAPTPAPTPSPTATPPALVLNLALNRDVVYAGEDVELAGSISNAGGAATIDLYLVIVLPGSAGADFGCAQSGVLVFLANRGTDFAVLCGSASAQTFPAWAERLSIPAATPVNLADLLTLAWPAGAPSGLYTFAIVATPPGAFADGMIDGEDLLAVSVDTLIAQ